MSSGSESGSGSELDDEYQPIQPRGGYKSKAFAQPTSFDAYLTATATAVKTSNAVFSSLEPLTPDDYTQLVKRAQHPKPLDATPFFPLYAQTLDAGFNIFFYGYGSKLTTLDTIARAVLSKRGPVLVSRCFAPDFTFKDFLATLQRGTSASALTLESIIAALDEVPHPLFLLMHSLDKAPPKVRSATLRLATHARVQVVASLDHIRASALFSQRDLAGWVWHDLTTLAPYDAELAHIDPLALKQQKDSAAADGDANGGTVAITEIGATHVLASVTARAKRLFALLSRRQLETAEGAAQPSAEHGMEHDALLHAARADFIATSDTALRALLGEFTDHGLIISKDEVLWVPLRNDVLQRVLDKLGKKD
ncbi:origin recognition complex subunit 2 [Exidia glandulosa HHB12029]|uniref:Origin recognition complex subunit 2 n=1 Tax=Exidia glandulosa HHB12029 TaxID=1314781 RepID=A0A165P0P0_EXIGL|nr:origin recognition complex subunit 2 [Exidia glandulosa HHB12029]